MPSRAAAIVAGAPLDPSALSAGQPDLEHWSDRAAPGLYLTASPIVTMNWLVPANQQLTLPLGGGIGKIFHLGKLPAIAQLAAYYNVVWPDFSAEWQLRTQLQFMFPK